MDHPTPISTHQTRRRLLWGFVFTVVVVAVVIAFRPPGTETETVLFAVPNPNGFPELCRLATRLQPVPENRYQMPPSELAQFIAAQQPHLLAIREALKQPTAIPLFAGHEWFRNELTNFANLKNAAVVMDLTIEESMADGDFTNALAQCRDLLTYSDALSRGGLVVHSMVGGRVEQMAIQRFRAAVPHLSVAQCRQTAAFLEDFQRKREPLETVFRHDQAWAVQSTPWLNRLMTKFSPIHARASAAGLARFKITYQTQLTSLNEVIVKLASWAFTIEQGRPPTNSSELVPRYLARDSSLTNLVTTP